MVVSSQPSLTMRWDYIGLPCNCRGFARYQHAHGKSAGGLHLVGLDKRGAIALHIKVSRSQLVRRLVNLPTCLVGLEAGSGSHHIARQIQLLGHEVRLIPAQYVKPFLKGVTRTTTAMPRPSPRRYSGPP